MGDRRKNFKAALELINRNCGKIIKASSLYETAAWGKQDQPAFYNQALEIETKLSAPDLMKIILKTETALGRKRKEKYGPRIIDIDILLYNDETYDIDFLKIPHPELTNRRFALEPLNEIAAQIIHPGLKKSIKELLDSCEDKLQVRKLKE